MADIREFRSRVQAGSASRLRSRMYFTNLDKEIRFLSQEWTKYVSGAKAYVDLVCMQI